MTIFSDTRTRAAAGNFLHVPMLTGTTANEGDIFVVEEEVLTFDFAVPGVTTAASNIITQVKVAISSYESDLIVSPSGCLHLSGKHCVYRSCQRWSPGLPIPVRW